MSKPKFLAFDTETAGLDPFKNPILTAYFAIVGEDYGILDELYMFIKPESPFDQIEAKAMEVNKIDLAKHVERPDAITRDAAKVKLKAFLKSNKPKGAKVKPLGHNVDFDIGMVKAQILPHAEWEELVHYGKIDTKMAGDLLKEAGWLPPEIGTLGSLVSHFNIAQLGAHEAKNDTLMMVEVYKKLIDTLSSKKNSNNENPLDILSLLEK
jgi:DNA polymerase III alpha subunit (gram-positive type)